MPADSKSLHLPWGSLLCSSFIELVGWKEGFSIRRQILFRWLWEDFI
jgi:hypothetical protein